MYNAGFTGRIVDVRFIETNSRLVAVSEEFEKIAFLDRFCTIEVAPQAGEDWQCIVRGDSNRQNSKRGALFLKPIRKLCETPRWSVEDQQETRVLDVCKPKVVRRLMFGKKQVSVREWLPSDFTAIETDWPEWIQERVVQRFSEYNKASRRIAYSVKMEKLAALRELLILPDATFQWVGSGDWLTDGDIWFPRERPVGSEWRDYPIPAIPEEYWLQFLDGLEGKIVVDLIPFRQEVLSRKAAAKAELTQRQTGLRNMIANHLWAGTQDCERVSFGRNIIFIVEKDGVKPIYVVDNPGCGAIYIFDDYDRALALANGSKTRSSAINDGVTRLIHRKGWELKLEKLLK